LRLDSDDNNDDDDDDGQLLSIRFRVTGLFRRGLGGVLGLMIETIS
jgi:hypothetical protein